MAVYYDSAQAYIDTATTLRERIDRLSAIITALETSALKAAGTGNMSEYSLDDGQTKIRTVYRNAEEVANAITAFERIRQMWWARLSGRHTRLVDGKNFIYPWGRC